MSPWTTDDIPPQHDRSVIVTGTGGLGLEDALALARAGADVILAGRNPAKGDAARQQIRAAVPQAKVQFEPLDLASLRSIQEFSTRLKDQRNHIDVLINNAAVMTPPRRQVTEDGFELQFGTNYLGHFALTAHLLPLLKQSQHARVITLSSVASRQGRLHWQDLQSTQTYTAMAAYSQSKLACLMFALELQRRSTAAHWGLSSLSAHPGISRTDLLHNGSGARSLSGLMRTYLWFLFQPAAHGAWSTLYAATSPDARGGAYYGPQNLGETRGAPGPATIPPQALDSSQAAQLWSVSEALTGQTFH